VAALRAVIRVSGRLQLCRHGADRNAGMDRGVRSMELNYGMTEKIDKAMIDEAHRRFDIFGARVIHRVGLLQPLDRS
jgi:molybdopterin synthase catalytic subunit